MNIISRERERSKRINHQEQNIATSFSSCIHNKRKFFCSIYLFAATNRKDMSQESNVRVCARFRPLNRIEETSRVCVSVPSGSHDTCELTTDTDTHPFTFSRVFSMSAPQTEVYADVGAPIVHDVMQGYNGTIFVYGQTGSGKTYTMMGAPQEGMSLSAFVNSSRTVSPPMFCLDGAYAGIIPRAVDDLFNRISTADSELEFEIKLFFVEIYMEHVRDLLDTSRMNLNVREETASNSFYVEGCVTPYVSSAQEVLEYVEAGLRNRTTAATRMNDVSSRSHCLLGITVKSVHMQRGEVKVGKLYLVDLAGTEKVAKTKAEGVQLEEAKLINKSLTTLGLVIKNLTDAKALHIPYRDSKLTKILQDALGGNSRTTLVVCCSPAFANWQETQSTLRFGARAKDIRNRAVVNKEYSVSELKNMLAVAQAEINRLRSGESRPTAAMPEEAVPAEDLTLQMIALEARNAESERQLNARIVNLEEELQSSRIAEAAAKGKLQQQTTIVRSLQEEIAAWEDALRESAAEIQSLHAQHRKSLQNVLSALQAERSAHQSSRNTCDAFVTAVSGLLEELVSIRCDFSVAVRCELESTARSSSASRSPSLSSATLPASNAVASGPAAVVVVPCSSSPASEADRPIQSPRIVPPHDVVVQQQIQRLDHLTKEAQRSRLEAQQRSFDEERRELRDRIEELSMKLELAEKKLILRAERLNAYRVSSEKLQSENRELMTLSSSLRRELIVLQDERAMRLRAQNDDAEFHYGHRLSGPRVVKHVRGGRDGLH